MRETRDSTGRERNYNPGDPDGYDDDYEERIAALEAENERLRAKVEWLTYEPCSNNGLRRCRHCGTISYVDGSPYWDEAAPLHTSGCPAGEE